MRDATQAFGPATSSTAGRIRTRAAISSDLTWLERFISSYTGDGTLLPRSRPNLILHLRDFQVAIADGNLIGCGALQMVDSTLGEIRSMAVDPAQRGHGVGSDILGALLEDASRLGLARVFCLTRKTTFFARHGFQEVSKERFPAKVWGDCLQCPRRFACDEIAMERALV